MERYRSVAVTVMANVTVCLAVLFILTLVWVPRAEPGFPRIGTIESARVSTVARQAPAGQSRLPFSVERFILDWCWIPAATWILLIIIELTIRILWWILTSLPVLFTILRDPGARLTIERSDGLLAETLFWILSKCSNLGLSSSASNPAAGGTLPRIRHRRTKDREPIKRLRPQGISFTPSTSASPRPRRHRPTTPDAIMIPFIGRQQSNLAAAVCPVCGQGFEDGRLWLCNACDTPHHEECRRYAARCAIFACSTTSGRLMSGTSTA